MSSSVQDPLENSEYFAHHIVPGSNVFITQVTDAGLNRTPDLPCLTGSWGLSAGEGAWGAWGPPPLKMVTLRAARRWVA